MISSLSVTNRFESKYPIFSVPDKINIEFNLRLVNGLSCIESEEERWRSGIDY
jgi:hypothetical protein